VDRLSDRVGLDDALDPGLAVLRIGFQELVGGPAESRRGGCGKDREIGHARLLLDRGRCRAPPLETGCDAI